MKRYTIKYTGQIKKSYKRCLKRGYDPSVLEKAVKILSETGALPSDYRPHILSGDYEGVLGMSFKIRLVVSLASI